jgi:outer membrane receptor protein involved in Fe transport
VLPTIDTVPEDSTVVTPKFTVAYKPNDNLNFYATAAKGYRLGDINAQGGLDPGQLTYGPDSLWNYEVGAKLGLLDDRLRIAAALYYIDWSNIQVIVTDLTTGSQFKSNEGSARSYGFEAEAILRPIDQLTISTAFNIGKAKITSGQFDGNRLPGAPRFQISNSVQYDFGRSEQSPTVRLEHIYVGSSFYNIENEPSVLGVPEPFAKVSGRHLVNARLTFPVSQRLSISAYAENLLNSSRITNVVDATANAYRQRPRTIGASFMASF